MVDSARHAETYQELLQEDPDLESNEKLAFIPEWANILAEEQNMSDSDDESDTDQGEEQCFAIQQAEQPSTSHSSEVASHTESQPRLGNHDADHGSTDIGPEVAEATAGLAAVSLVDKKQELHKNERVSYNYYDNVAHKAPTAPHSTDIPRSNYGALADGHLAAAIQ